MAEIYGGNETQKGIFLVPSWRGKKNNEKSPDSRRLETRMGSEDITSTKRGGGGGSEGRGTKTFTSGKKDLNVSCMGLSAFEAAAKKNIIVAVAGFVLCMRKKSVCEALLGHLPVRGIFIVAQE